jgi:hypothetical protein
LPPSPPFDSSPASLTPFQLSAPPPPVPISPPWPSPPPLLGLGLDHSSSDAIIAWLSTPTGLCVVIGAAVVTVVVALLAAIIPTRLSHRHPRSAKRAKTMPGRTTDRATRASYESSVGGSWRSSSPYGGTVRLPGLVRTSHASTADGCSPASSRADAPADGYSPALSRAGAPWSGEPDEAQSSFGFACSRAEPSTSPFHAGRIGLRPGSALRFAGGVRTGAVHSPSILKPSGSLHVDNEQVSTPSADFAAGDSSLSSPDLDSVPRISVTDSDVSPPSLDRSDGPGLRPGSSLDDIDPTWTSLLV